MADTVKQDDQKDETKAVVSERAEDELETTTANDGSIAINQVKTDEPAADKADPDKSPEPDATEETLIQTPTASGADAPVVVSDADVAAAEKENDPHQSLAEQIEVLTGEVQALEAKIEKLTSGVGEATPTPISSAPAPMSPVPVEPANKESDQTPPQENAQQSEQAIPSVAPEAAPAMSVPAAVTTISGSSNEGAKPVDDIYTKILSNPTAQGATPPMPAAPAHKDLNDDATIDEGTTGVGTIGEVLIVFGFIALLVLGASPFFKSAIGGSWEAVKSIGWPTATISLVLGFILFLFNKGRAPFKVFALLLLLASVIMTAAVFNYSLGPLSGLLVPVASFYR